MKAEDRAKAVIRDWQQYVSVKMGIGEFDILENTIADALIAAENEALERAARAVEEAVDEEWGWAGVEAIRALKHEEP